MNSQQVFSYLYDSPLINDKHTTTVLRLVVSEGAAFHPQLGVFANGDNASVKSSVFFKYAASQECCAAVG